MQPTLIDLLLACTALAAPFFDLGSLHRDMGVRSRLQAGFLVLAFMLVPHRAGARVSTSATPRAGSSTRCCHADRSPRRLNRERARHRADAPLPPHRGGPPPPP